MLKQGFGFWKPGFKKIGLVLLIAHVQSWVVSPKRDFKLFRSNVWHTKEGKALQIMNLDDKGGKGEGGGVGKLISVYDQGGGGTCKI